MALENKGIKMFVLSFLLNLLLLCIIEKRDFSMVAYLSNYRCHMTYFETPAMPQAVLNDDYLISNIKEVGSYFDVLECLCKGDFTRLLDVLIWLEKGLPFLET